MVRSAAASTTKRAESISLENILVAPFSKENRKQLLVSALVLFVLYFIFFVLASFVGTFTFHYEGPDNSAAHTQKETIVFVIFFILMLLYGVIVSILLKGYFGHWIKNILKSDLKLPKWDNLSDIFKVGLGVFVINFVYALPFLIAFLLSEFIFDTKTVSFAIAVIVISLLMLFVIPLLTIAIIRYLDTRSIAKAFDLSIIFSEFKSKISKYLLAFFIGLVAFVGVGFLSGVLLLLFLAIVGISAANPALASVEGALGIGLAIFSFIILIFLLLLFSVLYLYAMLIFFGLFSRVYAQQKK